MGSIILPVLKKCTERKTGLRKGYRFIVAVPLIKAGK
jgi:hypothetical protein